MTVATAIPEPEWGGFDTLAGRRYRDALVERAAGQASRLWTAEPLWSPTPIIGYRMWRMCPEGVLGLTGYLWPTRTIAAVCRRRQDEARSSAPHLAAEQLCRALCGINAYATPRALVAAAGGTPRRQRLTSGISVAGRPLPEALFGAVSLSGRIVEHEDGYRAEHATVIGLVMLFGLSVTATSDRHAIDELFADPLASGIRWEISVTAETADKIRATVADQLRRTAEECA